MNRVGKSFTGNGVWKIMRLNMITISINQKVIPALKKNQVSVERYRAGTWDIPAMDELTKDCVGGWHKPTVHTNDS